MNRNILLLAVCQALLFTCTSLMVTSSALVGEQLTPSPTLATLPLSLQFIAMMLTTFPASLLMKRVGRRAGLMTGILSGIAGASLCVYAVLHGRFSVFCMGSMLIGSFSSFGQYYRFTAADVASAEYRSRAISWVMAGGVAAAFLGPNLAAWTRQALAVPFAASFAALVGLQLLSLTLLSLLRIPPPTLQESAASGRPLAEIARQPVFRVAVLTGMISYGVMNLVMTATPLAMHAFAQPFADTAFVIQWHVFAMFAPAFFTGHLIRHLGVLNVMLIGSLLLIACAATNFAGATVAYFATALALLGVGWNFVYVGATTLLTDTYTPAEKAKAQALNDFMVFSTVAVTAFVSGLLQHRLGWRFINAGVLPPIVLCLAAIVWLRRRQPHPPAA
ncbi:MAG: MFS transporter [Gammaproteobacteria bacterium]